MAKAMSKDSQILLNMMRVQDSMNAVLGDVGTDKEVAKNQAKVDLLTFYILKLFAMRKNFSGKTKKAVTFFNDYKGHIISSSLNYCYPTVSNLEIVRVARSMADQLAREELINRYELCVKESPNYNGE